MNIVISIIMISLAGGMLCALFHAVSNEPDDSNMVYIPAWASNYWTNDFDREGPVYRTHTSARSWVEAQVVDAVRRYERIHPGGKVIEPTWIEHVNAWHYCANDVTFGIVRKARMIDE